jgi:hypothetical protein
MRRVFALLVITIMMSMPVFTAPVECDYQTVPLADSSLHGSAILSAAGGAGNERTATRFMSRTLVGQELDLLNTFANTSEHLSQLDLTGYHIPRWTLHKATLDIENITALLEKEVVGASSTPLYENFRIREHDLDVYYDQLLQGFYNHSHDGMLVNYSLRITTPTYSPAQQGWAYFVLRSNYSDSLSNLTIPVQVQYVGSTLTWANVSSAANLTAGKEYYIGIDGSALIEFFDVYPEIRWWYESGTGEFETRRHNTDGDTWGSDRPLESLLNYTYIPWNTTTNSTLTFKDPQEIAIKGNQTAVTGSHWSFSNPDSNITLVNFESNQSASVFHNLTLWYKKASTASTTWNVGTSGSLIDWNGTFSVVFPPIPSGAVKRYLNISKPSDWTSTALYNSTTPATDYGNHMDYGNVTHCSNLTNGTWTLTFTAHNYVTEIATFNSLDDTVLAEKANILVDMDINSTIQDEFVGNANSGATNLTIWYTGIMIHNPSNVSVSGGHSHYLWDIDFTASSNGTYMIEIYWANGTEAGYLTKEIFVYLPTTLTLTESAIEAFTNSSFFIEVNFTEVFTPRPIDNTLALVIYSFDGGTNTSMTSHLDGVWDATVSTVGNDSGLHTVTVYAAGYALENQTLDITVLLTHQTQQLSGNWSNTDNITYYETTGLTVYYSFVNGTSIEAATVNVTADSNTWPMTWNATSGGYWIKLNGTDFSTIPYTYTLNVSAWKSGHQLQYNDTLTLEVRTALGIDLDVNWNNLNFDLLYIDQFYITVNYTDSGVPVPDGTVRLTFNGSSPVLLAYNSTDHLYHAVLNASDYGVGPWSLTVGAQKIGLGNMTDTQIFIIQEDTPSVTSSWSDSSFTADYDTSAPLSITVTDSASAPITDASVTAVLLGTSYVMMHEGGGVYSAVLGPNVTRGLHGVQVTVVRAGFTTAILDLNFTILSTTELIMINFDPSDSWYQNESLTISVVYRDSFHSTPISGGSVNITINGVVYHTEYSDGVYSTTIFLDFTPGSHIVTIDASAEFCNPCQEQPTLTVVAKTHVYIVLIVVGASEGQSAQIEATLRDNATDGPVSGVTLYFEISIIFRNGTILVDEDIHAFPTNEKGVASFAYLIPQDAERLEVVARYPGTPPVWGTDTFLSAPVSPGILAMVMTFILTPPGMYIVLGFVVLAVVSAFYQKRVKPRRRAALDSLERQLQDFADLETLRHFMAVYLDRGTCVFYHPFAEERIQPDLISGFIAAITSVYGEIKGNGVRGTLEEIQYHGLRLNSYSGKYVIGILILEGEMTKLLRERLQFFIEIFEKHYAMYLEDWDGLIDCFDSEWVVSNLTGSFNYTLLLPHKFGKKRKVSKLDGKILDLIGTRRDNRREFNLRDLIMPVAALMGASEAKALDKLLAMEDKGLIEPISIQTVLQRQGLGLTNGEDETITAPVSKPKLKPAKKKIDAQDIDDIPPHHEPFKSREGTDKPESGKQRPIDKAKPKDIDKPSPILAPIPTTKVKKTKAKPAEKKKAPKEEMSEPDKFIAEVIDLLAKEKKKKDKSD